MYGRSGYSNTFQHRSSNQAWDSSHQSGSAGQSFQPSKYVDQHGYPSRNDVGPSGAASSAYHGYSQQPYQMPRGPFSDSLSQQQQQQHQQHGRGHMDAGMSGASHDSDPKTMSYLNQMNMHGGQTYGYGGNPGSSAPNARGMPGSTFQPGADQSSSGGWDSFAGQREASSNQMGSSSAPLYNTASTPINPPPPASVPDSSAAPTTNAKTAAAGAKRGRKPKAKAGQAAEAREGAGSWSQTGSTSQAGFIDPSQTFLLPPQNGYSDSPSSKKNDSSASTADKDEGPPAKKARGRPKKVPESAASAPVAAAVAAPPAPVTNPKGKPVPKQAGKAAPSTATATAASAPAGANGTAPEVPVKRKRGRPSHADGPKSRYTVKWRDVSLSFLLPLP